MSVPPCPAPIGVNVGRENFERRRPRRLALLGRLIDLAAYLRIDRLDRVFLDAELQQPLAVDFDRIALEPGLELALGPIGPRIRARVPAVAIGEAFDQRRAITGAR